MESYVREALAQKIIKQAGPWYQYNDEKVMGLNGLKKLLLDAPEKFEKLKDDVTT